MSPAPRSLLGETGISISGAFQSPPSTRFSQSQPANLPFASRERRVKLQRLHDPRYRHRVSLSLSLTFPPLRSCLVAVAVRQHPSSSLLRLIVPAIVIKSARRTGRGSLQVPSIPALFPRPSPSIALAVHRPRCTPLSPLRASISPSRPAHSLPLHCPYVMKCA